MNNRVSLLCLVVAFSFASPPIANAQDKVPPAPADIAPPRVAPVVPAPPRDPGVPPKSLGLPETVSPMIGFYQGVDPKEKRVKLAFVESLAETVEKVVKKNGVEEVVAETVYKPTAIAGSVPLTDIQFFNTQGKKLTQESVLAKLRIGDTLIISGDEKPLGAAYLKVIQADAIIAIFPLDPFIEPFVEGPGAPVTPVPLGPPAPK